MSGVVNLGIISILFFMFFKFTKINVGNFYLITINTYNNNWLISSLSQKNAREKKSKLNALS